MTSWILRVVLAGLVILIELSNCFLQNICDLLLVYVLCKGALFNAFPFGKGPRRLWPPPGQAPLMIVVDMVAAVAVNMGFGYFGFVIDKIRKSSMNGLVIFKNAEIADIVMNGFQ